MKLSKLSVFSLFLIVFLFSCNKNTDPVTVPVANYEDSLKVGLWAYYNLNNGNFSDLSGENHHMTGANGIRFSYDTWGNTNNALEFDGLDDYAVIDDGKQFPEGNFTVSFLVMPKTIIGRIF